MRRLHHPARRCSGSFLPHRRQRSRPKENHHDRKPRAKWPAASAPGSISEPGSDAVRLLHDRNDYVCVGASTKESQAGRLRHRSRDEWEYLSLRHLSTDFGRDQASGQSHGGARQMKSARELTRTNKRPDRDRSPVAAVAMAKCCSESVTTTAEFEDAATDDRSRSGQSSDPW